MYYDQQQKTWTREALPSWTPPVAPCYGESMTSSWTMSVTYHTDKGFTEQSMQVSVT